LLIYSPDDSGLPAALAGAALEQPQSQSRMPDQRLSIDKLEPDPAIATGPAQLDMPEPEEPAYATAAGDPTEEIQKVPEEANAQCAPTLQALALCDIGND
jgi:hypothetical protein